MAVFAGLRVVNGESVPPRNVVANRPSISLPSVSLGAVQDSSP
jgi:hypothetical protein